MFKPRFGKQRSSYNQTSEVEYLLAIRDDTKTRTEILITMTEERRWDDPVAIVRGRPLDPGTLHFRIAQPFEVKFDKAKIGWPRSVKPVTDIMTELTRDLIEALERINCGHIQFDIDRRPMSGDEFVFAPADWVAPSSRWTIRAIFGDKRFFNHHRKW